MGTNIGKIGFGMAGAIACAGLLSVGVAGARGSATYTQGFEQNTNGWQFGPQHSGSGSYGIARYHSGSATSPVGTINAASGNYYAVVNNATNNYLSGYGDAGYALFGGGTSYPGPYTMSISVYLNQASWAGSNTTGQGFMIDASPTAANPYTLLGSSATYIAGAPDYNMEAGFQLGSNGAGGLNVYAYYHDQTSGATSATAELTSITQSGWYTFAQTLSQGVGGTPFSTFSIYDNSGNLVGNSETVNWTAESNSDLGGPNYLWITGWNNGFSNNFLAIDNVSGFITPVPASFGLVAIGSLALIGGMALRRRTASKL